LLLISDLFGLNHGINVRILRKLVMNGGFIALKDTNKERYHHINGCNNEKHHMLLDANKRRYHQINIC
jgi:hypothetical protein